MSTHPEEFGPGFAWPLRVYYEDTDAAGVVYYANYLRFMERARTEWLRALGFEQDELRREQGVIFTVRRAEVDYLAPALFNDRLTVHASLSQAGRVSLEFRQQVVRDSDGTLCCAGKVKVACVDAERLRPCRIPAAVLAGIQSVTGRTSDAPVE